MFASNIEFQCHEAKALSAAAAKASSAPEAPFCKACHNMEKIGKQNGEAHLRVPPCYLVRKAPAHSRHSPHRPVAPRGSLPITLPRARRSRRLQ